MRKIEESFTENDKNRHKSTIIVLFLQFYIEFYRFPTILFIDLMNNTQKTDKKWQMTAGLE